MTTQKVNVIVMCGGKGTRFGLNTDREYGSKSLIPLAGLPIIDYVFQTLSSVSAEIGKIFVCVERDELRPIFEKKIRISKLKNALVYVDKGTGTIHAIYELREKYHSEKILVLFGHQIITAKHLKEILSWDVDGIVMSLYKTNSDNLRKITVINSECKCQYIIRGNELSRLKDTEYYGDVPYIFSMDFVRTLKNKPTVRSFSAIKRWFDAGGSIYGHTANFPHEFHYPNELFTLTETVTKLEKEISNINQVSGTQFILILSGPAASGKSTIAEELWKTLPNKPAYLSLDMIKHLVYHATSNDYYLDLASHNGLLLTQNFLNQGHSVIVDKAFGKYEYVEPFILEGKRRNISVFYFKLHAPLGELRRRNKSRDHHISEERINEIYSFHTKHDHSQGIVINTDNKAVLEIVRYISDVILNK